MFKIINKKNLGLADGKSMTNCESTIKFSPHKNKINFKKNINLIFKTLMDFTPDEFERTIIQWNQTNLIRLMMDNNLLKKEHYCQNCNHATIIAKYKRCIHEISWICLN